MNPRKKDRDGRREKGKEKREKDGYGRKEKGKRGNANRMARK